MNNTTFMDILDLDPIKIIENENAELITSTPNNIPLVELEDEWKSKDVLLEFENLKHSFNFIDDNIEERIVKTDEDFMNLRYLFLQQDYISIVEKENILKFVTRDKICFILYKENINSKNIELLFNSVYSPNILLVNLNDITFKPIQYIFDINIITNIFHNISNSLNLAQILELFITENTFNNDENKMLYNLFQIRDSISEILQKYNLMNLFNKELKIKQIIKVVEEKGIPLSINEYMNYVDTILNNFSETELVLKRKLDIPIGSSDILSDKQKLLETLILKDFPPSLNEDFLSSIKNSELSDILLVLIRANKLKTQHENLTKSDDDRLYLNYINYDTYGNIKNDFILKSFYLSKSSPIILGEYDNLFYRIFVSLSNIDYLVSFLNSSEDTILSFLSTRVFGNDKPINQFKIDYLIKSFLNGFYSSREIADYCFNEIDTFIPINEITEQVEIFKNQCPEIFNYIYNFNSRGISKDKRIIHKSNSTFYDIIKLYESDIYKELVVLVSNCIEDFNLKNKNTISLIHFQDSSLILESVPKSTSIAIDILNRYLSDAYTKYIKNVKCVCNIKIINN